MPPPRQSVSAPSLPHGFTVIRDILDGRNMREKCKVNVIGIVTDFRVPVPTKGTDWKCQITLYDSSVEESSESILLNVFRKGREMPFAGPGDVMLLTSVTVQRYRMDDWSLLTHFGTRLHVYEASKIPRPPADALCALRAPPKIQTPPGQQDNAYISYMFHNLDKSRVPAESEFEVMKIQSANVKSKLCELKDVHDGRFCDIIGEVVKPPFDLGDRMTLWLSDYTENPRFYHYTFGGGGLTDGRDGDPYGYTDKFLPSNSTSEWMGPFGKKSIQITVYEPHASVIREGVASVNTWVSIKNLQVKHGQNGANLEGFLRGDRSAPNKIGIIPLDASNGENMSPQLKEAIRRKRDYMKAKKHQLKDIQQAAEAGQKRKANTAPEAKPAKSSRQRRNENRKAKRASRNGNEGVEIGAAALPVGDLNASVKCENENRPASLLSELLEPVHHTATIDGQEIKLQLPFINTKYRTQVRVVDFKPSNLKDFAVPKRVASDEYDCLSDNEDSDSDVTLSQLTDYPAAESSGSIRWEWRCFLQLEDAAVAPKGKKERIWVTVDNQAMQCLTFLDASNLRHDPDNLEALRQKMWQLWGNLEEQKSREEAEKEKALRAAPGETLPQHSDDEDASRKTPAKKAVVANRPFACCIRQYGVKVSEDDEAKADAGEGKRWQRMFGLFGTRISGGA